MMKPTPHGPMFKSPEEILAECATVGITPKTPVVIYCFKGARASNTLLALEVAGGRLSLHARRMITASSDSYRDEILCHRREDI